MIDREWANRVLAQDPEFQRLRGQYNALGIWRFLVYAAAAVWAIATGIQQQIGLLIVGLLVSFILVMIFNYNRGIILARQQRRCIEMGLITEDDLR